MEEKIERANANESPKRTIDLKKMKEFLDSPDEVVEGEIIRKKPKREKSPLYK